jgi:hypothetical protein
MKQRGLVYVLGTFAVGLIVGCGSPDASQDDSSGGSADFDGVYRPMTSGGDIDAIAFRSGQGYLLLPTGCAAASCTDAGTYTLDAGRTLLTLTNAITGNQRTIDIRILKTSTGSSLLGTRDLTQEEQVENPSGSQVSNGQKQVKKDGQQQVTSGSPADLMKILQAAMNGTGMQNGGAPTNNDPTNNNTDPNNTATNNQANAALNALCSQPAPNGVMPTGATVTQDQLQTYFASCPAGPNTGLPTT